MESGDRDDNVNEGCIFLDTLELWKIKSDLVLCYKIIFGIVYLNTQDFFDLPTTSTRGQSIQILQTF